MGGLLNALGKGIAGGAKAAQDVFTEQLKQSAMEAREMNLMRIQNMFAQEGKKADQDFTAGENEKMRTQALGFHKETQKTQQDAIAATAERDKTQHKERMAAAEKQYKIAEKSLAVQAAAAARNDARSEREAKQAERAAKIELIKILSPTTKSYIDPATGETKSFTTSTDMSVFKDAIKEMFPGMEKSLNAATGSAGSTPAQGKSVTERAKARVETGKADPAVSTPSAGGLINAEMTKADNKEIELRTLQKLAYGGKTREQAAIEAKQEYLEQKKRDTVTTQDNPIDSMFDK